MGLKGCDGGGDYDDSVAVCVNVAIQIYMLISRMCVCVCGWVGDM